MCLLQLPAENEMVSALFAEFLSHRMHEATVQAWSRPGLVTRAVLLCFQVGYTPCPVMRPCRVSFSPQVQRAQSVFHAMCLAAKVPPCHTPGMCA